MLSSRYLHLHEALDLGPMWLRQGAHWLPENADAAPAAVATPAATMPEAAPAAGPAPASLGDAARQALLAVVRDTAPAAPASSPASTTGPASADDGAAADTGDNAFPALSADTLAAALRACRRCALHRERRQPLPGHGPLPAPLLVVSPNPAPEDDAAGRLFSGEAGVLLANMLRAIGVDPAAAHYTSLIKCTPNLSLHVDTEAACAALLAQQIAWVQPQAVLLLGKIFAQWPPARLTALLGQRPYALIPHPARLLRQSRLKAEAWQALQVLAGQLHRAA